jgi:hypothetical protein
LDEALARVRFVGMVEVGRPLRFVSTPSSARCRDRNASFVGGSQQALQRRFDRIGRIPLEGLLQIVLEYSVGAIILARVMEVGEHLFEFVEEQRLRMR